MVEHHQHNGTTTIVLLPNRSASWQETRLFVTVICATTLAIGIFWTLIGAWMILPFSGLEAGLVAYLFYRVCQSTYQRQVITCEPDQVLVQFGTHFPKRSWQLERQRVRVSVTEPRHPLGPLKLVIADATYSIELGIFLNKDDKQLALEQLRLAGVSVRLNSSDGALRL